MRVSVSCVQRAIGYILHIKRPLFWSVFSVPNHVVDFLVTDKHDHVKLWTKRVATIKMTPSPPRLYSPYARRPND